MVLRASPQRQRAGKAFVSLEQTSKHSLLGTLSWNFSLTVQIECYLYNDYKAVSQSQTGPGNDPVKVPWKQ